MNNPEVNKDTIYSLDFYDLITIIWNRKYLLLVIISIFSAASVFYSLSLEDYYKSSSLLAVSSNESQNSSLSQYAGLASMVGVNLPIQASENKTDLAIETLRSKDFFKYLIESNDHMLRDIFAAESYDFRNDKINYDSRIYDVDKSVWTRKVNYPLSSKPSYIESHEFFIKEILRISHDQDSGYITLSIEHFSPIFAKDLLEIMIKELNTQIRKRDLIEANKAVEFLLNERKNTSVKSITDAIDSLIESQLRTIMLSEIKEDYIVKIIDSPHVPYKKSKPSRVIVCFIGFLIGLIFSILYILLNYLRHESKS